MLAYVFWHHPTDATAAEDYERALVAFHEALRGAAPSGFVRSAVFRVDPAPFVGPAAALPAYEDWYLLSASDALDALDATAVSSACGPAHSAVAAMAGEGTAGLYRLAAGGDAVESAAAAWWLEPPRGEQRQPMVDDLARLAETEGGALWVRRMTFGPGPELCLLGTGTIAAAERVRQQSTTQQRALVWSAGGPPGSP
jgi:hypothetical protein